MNIIYFIDILFGLLNTVYSLSYGIMKILNRGDYVLYDMLIFLLVFEKITILLYFLNV